LIAEREPGESITGLNLSNLKFEPLSCQGFRQAF
jgi:hypothetical protein